MSARADAVVFLTGIPIAGAMILQGAAVGKVAEVSAGLVVAAVLGVPSLLMTVRQRLHR